MISLFKNIYNKTREVYHTIKFYYSVNWTKTLCFNFKKFPFNVAKKLPVFFYGKVKFTNIKGEIEIIGDIKRGMVGFGQPYEMNTVHKGTAEIMIAGRIIFKGHIQFGKDYFVYIGENGICEIGHMSSMGSNAKLICIEKVVFGQFVRIGSESQVIDTNLHQMINVDTKEKYKIAAPIIIGNYNYIGNRVSIMQNTITPNYCTVASNSLCNKKYSNLGENILIAGFPAKLIKNNISRDWEGERESLEKFLIV